MARDHIVRPRLMWSGVIVALVGACLLALWAATWQPTPGIAGAVLLVAGGLTAAVAGVLYDTHGGGRPLTGEIDDLREAHGHQGTKPGDMITTPRIRAHAATTSRRSEAVRQASQATARPALQPLGAWLLLIGAVSLIIAQGRYPHTHTGQDNATRSLLLAVVVGLTALRMLVAQRPRRVLSGLPATVGVLLIVFAVFTDHDRHATVYFELVAGAWILVAALLSLDLPREHPEPAALASSSSGPAMTPLVQEEAGVPPGRTVSRLRTVVALVLLIITAVRALRSRRSSHSTPDPSDQRRSLRYHVPVGQDPAAVIAALWQGGYEVVREHAPTHIQDLIITRPDGAGLERNAVRAAIARAPIDLEGAPAPGHEVVFGDEPEPAPPSV